MHDTSALEERGIPSVFVASEVFAQAADSQARSLGVEHHAVYVPHPIQDRTDEEMVQIAIESAQEVIGRLLAQPT